MRKENIFKPIVTNPTNKEILADVAFGGRWPYIPFVFFVVLLLALTSSNRTRADYSSSGIGAKSEVCTFEKSVRTHLLREPDSGGACFANRLQKGEEHVSLKKQQRGNSREFEWKGATPKNKSVLHLRETI